MRETRRAEIHTIRGGGAQEHEAVAKKVGNDSNSHDTALFRDSVGEVRPVKNRRLPLAPPAPKPRAEFKRRDEREVLAETMTGSVAATLGTEAGDELVFARPGIPRATLRKLRRGTFAVQDEIDLHGLTQAQAQQALRDFLLEVRRRRVRCVRIVHGKGLGSGQRGPVLKNRVNAWLRQLDEVLAFCSAPARDGGTGAIYVLLRQ